MAFDVAIKPMHILAAHMHIHSICPVSHMLRVLVFLLIGLVLAHAQCACTTEDDCPGICDSSYVSCGAVGAVNENTCCLISTCEGLATFFPVCLPDTAVDDCYGPLPIDFCAGLTCAFNCTSGAGNCSVDGTACTCEDAAPSEPAPAEPTVSTPVLLAACFGAIGGGALLMLVILLVVRYKKQIAQHIY